MAGNRHGYTLIELIVVIGIAALVFGMTIASFDSFNVGKKIDGETEILKSKIEEIFKKTSSNDLEGDVGCPSGSNECDSSKYTLAISADRNSYSYSFYCDCPGADDPITKKIYDNKKISSTAKITFSSSPISFEFQRNKITTGCINVINNGTNYNSVSFSYPGNVAIGVVGSSCP